jgi:hypothetical protein
MDNNVLIALIGAGSSGLVAITALILNYRGFASIDARFGSLDARFLSLDARFGSLDGRFGSLEARMAGFETRMAGFETRVDNRLNMMQTDMRDLNKAMAALEVDVALVKDKVGL